MALIMRRRKLVTAGVLAGVSVALPFPVQPYPAKSYGYYGVPRMRAPQRQDGELIWQWLILLVDASSSMMRRFEQMSFYHMQIEATARALMEPCVVARLIGSPSYRTALSVILWSSSQEITIGWTVIRSIEDIATVATKLRKTANHLDSDTGVAAAVHFATKQLKAGFIPATSRKIINLSANGRDNHGENPSAAARAAEDLGITINAVVMKGYDATVDDIHAYYQQNVITRDGLVFKVEHEQEALEALAVANASKFCAEVALAPAERSAQA